jgi:hypothetical protein
MKMLVHRIAGGVTSPFNLADLKSHLRVDDDAEDNAIQNCGWAAAAEFEHFAQIAILNQTIRVTIFDLGTPEGLDLPIGPVAENVTPTVTIDGASFTDFHFVEGTHPFIRWGDTYFDQRPDRLTIEYQAGFGTAATDIPPDIAQAVMDQAALHYDARSPMNARSLTTSPHMARVGARYRGVQL